MFATAYLLALVAAAAALPSAQKPDELSGKVPTLPATFTMATTPLSYVALGVGVQNYTCSAAGTYASAGAVAELLDMGCVKNLDKADPAGRAWKIWENARADLTIQDIITKFQDSPRLSTHVLGQHYFIAGATAGSISPKWDFTSAALKGHSDGYVTAAKDFAVPAVNATADVPLLQLHGTDGKLATTVYRLSTHGGQAPLNCTTVGSTLSVKYTSMYWLYGSTVSA